ncbi:DUF2637 domain-containing protein [Streptomyces sp. V4-01]|uniref:DUF2637 domain-containing protein n=1 Tax=Actinacidiphila polyblastidii TaxID=3110430 RepID=A0ABU7PKT0_9ACTN|nr:DUF2637 domain-containing protein [Streptomyces sp. V4-01]
MSNRRAITALAAGAAAVTIALTAAAFWLSYEHLHDIAGGNGLSGTRAWAWPATVDLFIVTGELLTLRASLRARIDWWAIALAALGSIGSIALNISGVGAGASVLAYVVAAVPPTAALVAFGALMRQVHEVLDRISDAPAAAPHPQPDTAPQQPAPAAPAPAAPAYPHGALELHLAPMLPASPEVTADAHPSAPAPVAPPAPAADRTDDELIEAARALATTGPLSLRRMQRELGIGQARAQRIRDAVDSTPAPASEEAAS